jgi:hypothetical protein
VTNKAHLIKQHIGTAMHRSNLLRWNKRNKQDCEIKDMVTDHFKRNPTEALASVGSRPSSIASARLRR